MGKQQTVSEFLSERVRGKRDKDLAEGETIEDVIGEEFHDPNLKLNAMAYVNRLLKIKGKAPLPFPEREGD